MQPKRFKPFFVIAALIAVTCFAMAFSAKLDGIEAGIKPSNAFPTDPENGIVSLSAQLTQNKILYDGDGTVTLAVSLRTGEVQTPQTGHDQAVDMVIVLDRSGSMDGQKLDQAKDAVLNLLSHLSVRDRFALVAYSDRVYDFGKPLAVSDANRRQMEWDVRGIAAGGGTNLGAGLQKGIDLLLKSRNPGRMAKLILISDGLANQGITDEQALGRMAAVAVAQEFSISTVGVGTEFNEQLMTTLADQGTGTYYYLENPEAFANVFRREVLSARAAVATALEISVPLAEGVALTDAAGYPIQIKDQHAVFYPGNLHAGQSRRFFLTFNVPTGRPDTFTIQPIRLRYLYNGAHYRTASPTPFNITCVKDPQTVFSSIDKTAWEEKVLANDYSRLREEVAAQVRTGNRQQALDHIEAYYTSRTAVNRVLDSDKVAKNLENDLEALRSTVRETFSGAPAAVEHKQKQNAKQLQYEGYRDRRKDRP